MSDIELIDVPPQPTAVVRGNEAVEGLPRFLGAAFSEVMQVVGKQGQYPAGPPFGRYQPQQSGGFEVEAGFPIPGPIRPSGRVQAGTLPGGLVARVLYQGEYSGVGSAYEAVERWLVEHGYVSAGTPWESYLDGPDVAQPRTVVQVPCVPRASTSGNETA